jgi:drug/metabolite transporter (DMT)-like permease
MVRWLQLVRLMHRDARTEAAAIAALLASSVLWGLTWWPLKYFSRQGIEGAPLMVVAYGVAALVLTPVVWRERAAWRNRWHGLPVILLLGGYANLAFMNAMIYGEVVRAMTLFYLAPAWGVIGGRLFLGEHVDRERWIGVVLALAGAFLLLDGAALLRAPPTWVDLLAVSSGLTFALNNIAFRATATAPLGGKLFAMFMGCFLIAALLVALQGRVLPVLAGASWLSLAAFGVGWLLLGTLGTQWGVSRIEAGRASIIIVLELVTAVASATVIGGEHVGAREAIGAALIFSAALLEARRLHVSDPRQATSG